MYKSNINFNLYKTFYDVAISRSIKTLEEELNTKLFFRTKRGIELTEKGKELFFYVEQSYNSLVVAERSMFETKALDRGKLSIGIPSHIATFYLFDAIDAFHKEYPNIEITIISKSTSGLIEKLKSHEIDFIIDSEPIKIKDKEIVTKHIKDLKNTFVASENFDISHIKTLKDLEKVPLILPIKGTANRTALDALFIEEKIKVNNVLNIHTSEVIIGAIKRSLGVGYVIRDLVLDDIKRGNLKELKFDNIPEVGISLVYIPEYITVSPREFLNKYMNIKI